ncbi:MAG: 50S ribosomal protein L17 [Marinilabiliaceae bacterium]|nr:50S ribosomal protein L17 [Marinilabiliaceae bacterium]
MRHRKKINHLGRTSAHRKAMLANMASSLIVHKRIKTTVAKAKALRVYVEPLITKTKNLTSVEDKTNAQRLVFSYLQDKVAVKELFEDVASKVADRPGGYTRILKVGNRIGDAAEMCFIELVDYNENMLGGGKASDDKKKTRRRRAATAKKVEATPVAEIKSEESVDAKEVNNQTSEEAKADDKE